MRGSIQGALSARRRASRAALSSAAWLVILAGCGDELAAPQPLSPGNFRTAVTQEVAARLGAGDRFVLPDPPREPYAQVSAEAAAEIAVAWSRTFGQYVRGEFERIHGKPIDFQSLRVGAPAYYANAAYEPVAADVHPGIRNGIGPQYLVYLVDDEGPVISIAVAAFGQSRVEGGRLILPSAGGMEVVPNPLPRDAGFFAPLSPEQAAALANRATGMRVSAVPELVMPGRGFHPQHARWRVSLERPVAARVGSRAGDHLTREVYVGLRGTMSLPAQAQPAESSEFDPSTQRHYRVVRRAGRPVSFERAGFPNH
ncbi:MAG: hypothetical protein AVDCRST_MAG89-336 [uncultured Gemmatimonadetes bacterium]|uniref:Uncharacterized protein n=1 Tax=uncultured Gemmatimonadota bacterium TaxID=203437 RepID=A0A6J4K8P9_9BACT|nr:MAG: hypothetical protein AVDCRST_MAG89-336 [uncultured Gemmatimonadota bacterium]